MKRELDIIVSPEIATDEFALKQEVAEKLDVPQDDITFVKILKRSIDARGYHIKFHLKIQVYIHDSVPEFQAPKIYFRDVSNKEKIIIVGSGPAGLFAALRLIELDLKPIIIERGKTIKERRRDVADLNKLHLVNPDSNYCFGEGGAGTFSDGKLYTRSTKRGDVNKVLQTLVAHGASEDILIDAHPHIGTNKLPPLIESIRDSILKCGGEIHFNTRVTDFIIDRNEMKGVIVNNGEKEFLGEGVILATGHSARDIFELLHKKNIHIEAKPFAMGVRIEHPQSLIDSIQYKTTERSEILPPASYSFATQVNERGVYSFCMCPGGIIAPCATAEGEIVTNGWSPSKRNNPYANSGIVVSVEEMDLKKFEKHGALAGLRYQQELEKAAFIAGGGGQVAPAQRMTDFVKNKISPSLPETSYLPGIKSAALHEFLPKEISKRLQIAFVEFGKKMPSKINKGYFTEEAVLHGVESRTSSPVRIPRNPITLEHIEIENLYPCGEGAGYAGGIVSAAIDGQKCAESVALKVK